MKIIITAAGMGNRFVKENITKPKYLIKVNGKTLLEHSLQTLSNFFLNEFIFIFRNNNYSKLINDILKNVKNQNGEKITNYHIINISEPTSGQAETALFAEKYIKSDDSILIFNIDTLVTNANKYISINDIEPDYDGLIYTTKANGTHWSFAKTLKDTNVVCDVSEKIKISDNASIGLYYFKSFFEFKKIVLSNKKNVINQYNELYIMPIYIYMINDKKKIVIKDIPFSEFIPLGTPEEVKRIDSNFILENKDV